MADFLTDISDDSFENEVLQSDVPVIVDFWATWCGPCKAMEPFLDKMAGEHQGKVKVVKINTEDHTKVAEKYGVTSLPTLLAFRGGELVERNTGAQNPKKLQKLFGSLA